MKDVFKIGVIGCGDISTRNYVPNIMDRFSNMEIYALCDLNRERAEAWLPRTASPMCFLWMKF